MSNETGDAPPQGPPLGPAPGGTATSAQLAFIRSAYGSAEGTIRLADEKVGYLLLFLGILVATLSVRADALLGLLTGARHSPLVQGVFLAGCLLFLGAAGLSLAYAVRSRALSQDPPADIPRFLAHLARLEAAGLAEELARALHKTAGIAHRKLTLLRVCLSWAAVAFVGWAAVLLMSVVF